MQRHFSRIITAGALVGLAIAIINLATFAGTDRPPRPESDLSRRGEQKDSQPYEMQVAELQSGVEGIWISTSGPAVVYRNMLCRPGDIVGHFVILEISHDHIILDHQGGSRVMSVKKIDSLPAKFDPAQNPCPRAILPHRAQSSDADPNIRNRIQNWKTYIDDNLGFEIRYPPSWHHQGGDGGPAVARFSNNGKVHTMGPNPAGSMWCDVFVVQNAPWLTRTFPFEIRTEGIETLGEFTGKVVRVTWPHHSSMNFKHKGRYFQVWCKGHMPFSDDVWLPHDIISSFKAIRAHHDKGK